jgi:CHAD domain-containing protein
MGSARHDRSGHLGGLIAEVLSSPGERIVLADKDDDVESIHRERIEIRRLRTRLQLLRPVLERDRVDALSERLRHLGRAIGSVRDLDVMGERLDTRGSTLGIDVSVWTVDVSWRAARARDVLRARRASPRHGELMSEVRATTAAPPIRSATALERDADEFLRRRLSTRAESMEEWIAELPDEPSDEECHQLRRRLRRTRYAFEGAAPALGKPADRAARALKRATDVLGDLHDSVITRQWLDQQPSTDRAHLLSAATLQGYELAAATQARTSIRPTLTAALDAVSDALD